MVEKEIEEVIKEFKSTIGLLRKEIPKMTENFLNLIRGIQEGVALSTKEKELICLGISLCIGCETCIVMHTKAAIEAGATKEEIIEVFGLAIGLRGSSVIGYITIGIKALEEFSL